MSSHERPSLRRQVLALARRLRAWWGADRLRVSTRSGLLFRLEPGSALRVRGVPAVILQRHTGETPGGRYVAYDCDAVGGPGQLVVRLAGEAGRPRLAWTHAGRHVELPAEDIEPFPVRRARANTGFR